MKSEIQEKLSVERNPKRQHYLWMLWLIGIFLPLVLGEIERRIILHHETFRLGVIVAVGPAISIAAIYQMRMKIGYKLLLIPTIFALISVIMLIWAAVLLMLYGFDPGMF